MTLQQQIKENIKSAMKSKDVVRLETYRGIQTAFVNVLVATGGTPQSELSDDKALAVITRLAKQRKDSTAQFRSGGREDLAVKEEAELAVLSELLPVLMPKDEVKRVVAAKISELGVTDKKGAGKLMATLMSELKGKADGADVKACVDELLAQ